jgi:hypothetical protein
MMHEHDFDLIASIAEGELGPDEQAAAEALLVACPACRADLQLQRQALAFLQAAPPVLMTDIERAALHKSVAENLPPARRPSSTKTNAPWFQRLMPAMAAAAALIVVVGVGSVLVTGSGDDMADEPTAAATAVDRQQVPAEEELGEDSGGNALADGAAEPTTTLALAAPGVSGIQEYGIISLTDLEAIVMQLKALGAADDEIFYSRESLQVPTIEPALVCAETALSEGTVTTAGRATLDGDAVEIYRIDDLVAVYSTADCSLIDEID